MTRPSLIYIALAFMLSMAVSGCGIKPGNVAAPKGAETNGFPHVYPAPDSVPDTAPVPATAR